MQIAQAIQRVMQIVTPPRKNRKNPREYDAAFYKLRHLGENAFLYLYYSVGGELPYDMLKIQPLSLPRYTYAALPFELISCDHTI